MTEDPLQLAAIGIIAAFLALVSLGSIEKRPVRISSDTIKLTRAKIIENQAASRDAIAALREGRRIDINTASAADLQLLPGIGPKLAQRIVANREKLGAYRSAKEITRVKGIGPVTFERIEALVTTASAKPESLQKYK
ncbi:MAG: helix-hairpin-helix domain-containing protein [Deltaproteobacteria bacterium]|nr:helix-hairpin-helix domain-containing protein [Deltaproteobacteria bacterium]